MTTYQDERSPMRADRARRKPQYITDAERRRRYAEAVWSADQGLDTATIAEKVGLTTRQVEERLRYLAQQKARQSG